MDSGHLLDMPPGGVARWLNHAVAMPANVRAVATLLVRLSTSPHA